MKEAKHSGSGDIVGKDKIVNKGVTLGKDNLGNIVIGNNNVLHFYNSEGKRLITKEEIEAQRKKEEKSIFSITPKLKQIYINRDIDVLLSNRIAQKKACVLFLHGQGGIGKSTLLDKFSNTHRPTIFIQINEQVEMSIVNIFLDENKTITHNCPKFEVKLNEIFIEKKNDKEIPFNAEFELLEAIREDFGEHGVFIVDTFEKNKNSRIHSSVNFDNNTVHFTRTESHQRFRDYLNSLVHLFVSHTTFIIAGRNRIDDVNESRNDEKFLNINNVEELEMKKFSTIDIELYIQEYGLESPTQKQLTDIEKLTHGNPLILSLFVEVASEYDGWDQLNYDEMKKIVYEDEDYGLIYYFTKRILSHIDRVDIWKLIVPRILSKEIEPLLFGEQKIFKLLVDVGLLYRGKGKERNIYTLHDDVAMAIKNYAEKDLDSLALASWHDHTDVIGLHTELIEFYEKYNELYGVSSKFEACYHKMMLKQDFEKDFEVMREEFIGFVLGALSLSLKKKMDICGNWKSIKKSEVSQYIKDLKDEKKEANISNELYNRFSSDLAFGVVDSLYNIDYLLKLFKYDIFENDWSFFYVLGIAYSDKQEYDKSIKAYKKVIEINPKKDEGYLGLSAIYIDDLNQIDKGIYYINKAIKINPKSDTAYQHMGVAYTKKEEYDNAIEACKKAIEINPKNHWAYDYIGEGYNQKQEYFNAIEAYEKAIEINPENEDVYLSLSKIYIDFLNQIDKGIYYINKAIKVNPKSDVAYQYMGVAYTKKGEYDNAIEASKKAVEINPKNHWAYYYIGEGYNQKQEYFNAIKAYKKVIDTSFKNDGLYLKLSRIYIDFLNQTDKGIYYINKAIEINPKDEIAYQHMVVAYTKKKKYDKVIEAYQKIVEINPKDDEAYFNMGNIYDEKQDYNKAITAYKKVIDINPENDNVFLKLSRIYIDFLNQTDKGIYYINKAIEINPKDELAYQHMVVAYSKSKEYDKVIEAYFNMENIYAKQKDLEKMIEVWEKIFKLNPKRLNFWQRFFLWIYRKSYS